MPPSGGACCGKHGPRLNRYSLNYAMYLGHHHGFRRETGETQLSFNYYRAFSDYINRFTFGQGVHFRSPKATEAIIPDLLKMVWEEHNNKEKVLLEIGQLGGVTGDAFVKVAYEEAYEDPAGNYHPGRVRILPLNPSFVYPEFHPHDRERFLRVKLRYRFWGTSLEGTRQVFTYCVDDQTQMLTSSGWKHWNEVSPDDEALSIDPQTGKIVWRPITDINVFNYAGTVHHWNTFGLDAVTTPNHRWVAVRNRKKKALANNLWFKTTEDIESLSAISLQTGGGISGDQFAATPTLSDEMVELLGWTVTEGCFPKTNNSVMVAQSQRVNPHKTERIRLLMKHFAALGATATERPPNRDGVVDFYFGKGVAEDIRALVPDKRLSLDLLRLLTADQADLLLQTVIDGDGHRTQYGGLMFLQKGPLLEDVQILAAMLGYKTSGNTYDKVAGVRRLTIYTRFRTARTSLKIEHEEVENKLMWCPSVPGSHTFLARRNGKTYWTGNTEILTEDVIEEYINDELIDQRPNPLGIIPVVHIPNYTVSGSPWGIPDCFDIITLNRHYNEVAENIADILAYHSAPVTIITGAKIDNLEKGASKVWAGLPKDAQVFNLEGGYQGLQGGLTYLESLKRSMHEMVGVPENALGQVQPISNTSGVALSIQFQPLMNRRAQKVVQYGAGLEKINEIALRTLALKEPDRFIWNPDTDTPLTEGQLPELDLRDPMTYQSYAHFPPPLPLDKLVVLNEIQQKMQLGLESREGALRTLGEEFPEEKLAEIRFELREDALQDGGLQLMKAQIQKQIMDLTGMQVTPDGMAVPMEPVMTGDGDVIGDGITGPNPDMSVNPISLELEQEIQARLVTDAYGSKMAQFRGADKSDTSES